jgi:hypothetical protein
MRFRKEVIVVISFLLVMIVLSGNQGFCQPFTPILDCDSTPVTGIGAQSFTDGNGNAVTITSVTHVDAVDTTPAYCEVKGTRLPQDPFIIALPDSWGGEPTGRQETVEQRVPSVRLLPA